MVRAIYDAWEQRASTDHLVAPDLGGFAPPRGGVTAAGRDLLVAVWFPVG